MSANNTCLKLIKDLVIFYVKENYNAYLTEKNIKTIESKDLDSVIDLLYTQKKEHLKITKVKQYQVLISTQLNNHLVEY